MPNNFIKHEIEKKSDELKKLILEHPDYSIVVLAGEDANIGDYYWMFCSDISFGLGEILTVEPPFNEEAICCDRDEFAEQMQTLLEDNDEIVSLSDEEFDERLKAEIAKYDKYWEKVIMIWANN